MFFIRDDLISLLKESKNRSLGFLLDVMMVKILKFLSVVNNDDKIDKSAMLFICNSSKNNRLQCGKRVFTVCLIKRLDCKFYFFP